MFVTLLLYTQRIPLVFSKCIFSKNLNIHCNITVLTMTTRELQNVLNRWWSAAKPGNKVFDQANKESQTGNCMKFYLYTVIFLIN